jgi:hypothetical protein
MQSAVKPTVAALKEYGTTGTKLAKTLLEEGVPVTQNGLIKLQSLLSKTNAEIKELVSNAPGMIPKDRIAAQAAPVAQRIARQTNPTKDLKAVGETVGEFLNHPVYKGDLTVAEAQAMKQGTYQQIGKKYGEISSAEVETQKALARGLKEEVANAAPGVAKLNERDAKLMAAAESVGRRVAISGNRDPVGFAWVAHNPATFIAALIDRQPVIKSMLALGMFKSAAAAAKVSPQMFRFALAALASTPDDDEQPTPQSSPAPRANP